MIVHYSPLSHPHLAISRLSLAIFSYLTIYVSSTKYHIATLHCTVGDDLVARKAKSL